MTNRASQRKVQAEAIQTARNLAALGIPIFLARHALDGDGDWDKLGGVGGYQLSKAWQRTKPDPAALDRWRPGMAVCMVTGHGLDVVDIDPRNGGDESLPGLKNEAWPKVYGVARTPSGGEQHTFEYQPARDQMYPGAPWSPYA